MNKNIYLVVGTLFLAIAMFLGAFYIYKKNQNILTTGPESISKPSVADWSLLVRDWSPTLGPTMARINIVEFLDPECESCRAMHPVLKNILKDYEGKIRYVLRYMPLHQNSGSAAAWLEAAREQDKFWEALDILFEKQPEWASHHAPQPALVPKFLKAIGVDTKRAALDKDKQELAERIERDKQDGTRLGVTGTPTFFVNGRRLMELGDASLRSLIEEEILRTSQN